MLQLIGYMVAAYTIPKLVGQASDQETSSPARVLAGLGVFLTIILAMAITKQAIDIQGMPGLR